MTVGDISTILGMMSTLIFGPYYLVYVYQKPNWKIERVSMKVRIKSVPDSEHTYFGNFIEWKRSEDDQDIITGTNGDVVNLFYTKRILLALSALLSFAFGLISVFFLMAMISEAVKKNMKLMELVGKGDTIHEKVVYISALVILYVITIAAGYVTRMQIGDQIAVLRLDKTT